MSDVRAMTDGMQFETTYSGQRASLQGHLTSPNLHGRFDCTVPTVAVVGSRACDVSAQLWTTTFAAALVKEGVAVLNGLAHGIDWWAAHGALQSPGQYLGIVPEFVLTQRGGWRSRADEVIRRGGAVLAVHPGQRAAAWQFAARNREIVEFSDVVVVVSAPAKSGALIAATHAQTAARPLFIGPQRPGPLAEGTIQLSTRGIEALGDSSEAAKKIASIAQRRRTFVDGLQRQQ